MSTLPSPEKLTTIAASMGISFTPGDAEEFLALMTPFFEAAAATLQAADPLPIVRYPRTPGYRPSATEDPLNAWYRKTSIKGAPSGKLAGKTAVLKDNVLLAGVPMMNGASFLEDMFPKSTPLWPPDCSMRALRSSAKRIANISAFPDRAIPTTPVPATIPGSADTRLAARPRAAPRSWRPAKRISRSAAIKADRFACRPPSAASSA